ncbi:MAG: hypothetical protein M3542_01665 [Acidobacteriota bacterium]|nr:hypothetical protein [Acidobacteriota bacterium]MDQ5870947.1 hypothetical protein [Acidobacteriota bacterium]
MLGNALRNAVLATVLVSVGIAFGTAAPAGADSDEIRSVWTEIEAGKPVFVAKSHLVRKTR